jgi:hypothetical protein
LDIHGNRELGLKFTGLAAALTALIALQGCGDDISTCSGPFCQTPPTQGEASSIQPGPGNGQSGAPGRDLPDPVAVMVVDSSGHGVSGITVRFSVTTGGGTLSSDTAQSGSDGMAFVNWKLGNSLGAQSLKAQAANDDGDQLNNSPLQLSAEAVPPQPARIVLVTPLAETAQNGVRFEQQPVIQVFDADDQPVPQVEVLASVSSGGATLSGTTSASSDTTGLATFADLALVGPQGPQSIRFSVTTPALEATSGPIQLMAGTAASLSGVEPLTYQGTVGSPVSPGPSVIAKDAAGNPVPGVSVNFTTNRNASVSPETAVTNDQGVAQVSWTLGTTANVQYSLTASLQSSPSEPVRFLAVAQPGAAGRLRITTQPSSPTQSGTPFAQQPVIQVVDQNGNPTPQAGLTVTATISSGPAGSLQGGTATTDATGQAAFSGLAITGGVGSYTLSFSGPELTGVTSSPFSIQAGGAAQLAFITLPSTAARSRSPLVIQPVLQIQDPSGNPIQQAGTTVTAAVSTPSTSLTGETAITDANGRAAFSSLTIIGIPGPKDLTFSATGLQTVSARVTLPSVQTVAATPNHPVSAMVGTTVAGPVIAWTFRDAATRPVADANFTLGVPSGGTAATLTPLSDANGVVQVGDWTLGPTAGYQYLELRLPDNRVFRDSILATPGPAADLRIASGDGQSAPVSSQLPLQLVARVVDQNENGVAGINVQWSTCDGVAGPAVTSDANGFSSVTQNTGDQPSGDTPFCTRASAAIGSETRSVDFHYTVTPSATSQGQAEGLSGAASRHSGPPPIATPKRRSAPSR